MLLPLSEPGFFGLDLLGKALPQLFFLFLELGVVEPLDLWLTKLAGLHLLLAVALIVLIFGC